MTIKDMCFIYNISLSEIYLRLFNSILTIIKAIRIVDDTSFIIPEAHQFKMCVKSFVVISNRLGE